LIVASSGKVMAAPVAVWMAAPVAAPKFAARSLAKAKRNTMFVDAGEQRRAPGIVGQLAFWQIAKTLLISVLVDAISKGAARNGNSGGGRYL
jgi:hypothetical protein